MEEQDITDIADKIISNLEEQDLTFSDAVKVLKKVDGKIRTKRAELFTKIENSSLKDIMKEEKS